jgi:hypothetical protein
MWFVTDGEHLFRSRNQGMTDLLPYRALTDRSENMKPDYFLVLPWHFKEGIVRREQAFLDAGGKMIFPFPEIEII